MDRTFAEGDLVALFPEGDFQEGGDPGEFEPHLASLLVQDQVPTLPGALGGGLWASHFSRKGSAGPRGALRARITLRIGLPLPPGAPADLLRDLIQDLA